MGDPPDPGPVCYGSIGFRIGFRFHLDHPGQACIDLCPLLRGRRCLQPTSLFLSSIFTSYIGFYPFISCPPSFRPCPVPSAHRAPFWGSGRAGNSWTRFRSAKSLIQPNKFSSLRLDFLALFGAFYEEGLLIL